jgi:hypothetical protein
MNHIPTDTTFVMDDAPDDWEEHELLVGYDEPVKQAVVAVEDVEDANVAAETQAVKKKRPSKKQRQQKKQLVEPRKVELGTILVGDMLVPLVREDDPSVLSSTPSALSTATTPRSQSPTPQTVVASAPVKAAPMASDQDTRMQSSKATEPVTSKTTKTAVKPSSKACAACERKGGKCPFCQKQGEMGIITLTFDVTAKSVPRIIGAKGIAIDGLRKETRCKIDISGPHSHNAKVAIACTADSVGIGTG